MLAFFIKTFKLALPNFCLELGVNGRIAENI